MVILTATLYIILRRIIHALSVLAVLSKLVYIVLRYIGQLEVFGALRLMGRAGSLRSFGPDGLAAVSGMHLDFGPDAYYVGLVFTALGSTSFAWGVSPVAIHSSSPGGLGILTYLFEALCGIAYLFQPRFGSVLSPSWYELRTMTFDCFFVPGSWSVVSKPASPTHL